MVSFTITGTKDSSEVDICTTKGWKFSKHNFF